MKKKLKYMKDILGRSNIWVIRVPERNNRKKRSNIQLYNG